jgi:hypothetical protein
MDLLHWRYSICLRAAFAAGLLGVLVLHGFRPAQAHSPKTDAKNAASSSAARVIRTRNFVIHTDLTEEEAKTLLERMETLLRQLSNYWGRPMKGTIECFVVRDFNNFPPETVDSRGMDGIKTAEGVTLMSTMPNGKCNTVKSFIYSNARPEVVLHELVHAYCHQTFGHIGPIWYNEGMAEMGHYWKDGDHSVHVEPREIEFLRDNPPISLAATLSSTQVTGDSWQNYASRWSLCHFLVHNPNYASEFRSMGRRILKGKDANFEQTYAHSADKLWFEYRLFLKHIDQGYRVDLCAWDWDKKFVSLSSGRAVTTTVKAGRGWQPSGLRVNPAMQYIYAASGDWHIASQPLAVNAQGDGRGRGRLVGILMKDYQLSEEFELSDQGLLSMTTGGDLYLRCRNDWKELAGDSGQISVRFEGGGTILSKASTPAIDSEKTKTGK